MFIYVPVVSVDANGCNIAAAHTTVIDLSSTLTLNISLDLHKRDFYRLQLEKFNLFSTVYHKQSNRANATCAAPFKLNGKGVGAPYRMPS